MIAPPEGINMVPPRLARKCPFCPLTRRPRGPWAPGQIAAGAGGAQHWPGSRRLGGVEAPGASPATGASWPDRRKGWASGGVTSYLSQLLRTASATSVSLLQRPPGTSRHPPSLPPAPQAHAPSVRYPPHAPARLRKSSSRCAPAFARSCRGGCNVYLWPGSAAKRKGNPVSYTHLTLPTTPYV